MMTNLASTSLAIAFFAAINSAFLSAKERPNVLFVAIDDLRPALGCYGDQVAISPNIDRLAKRGTTFLRAYCQQAVCSPSRLSVITGRRPDTTRVWDLKTHFREALPDVVTLPQLFKQHGYHSESIGKILHGGGNPAKDPPSWSVEPKFDTTRDPKVRYALPENLLGKGLKRAATEAAEVPDDYFLDGMVCDAAIKTLRQFGSAHESETTNDSQRPFFLAVGFRKPHLPFCAPKKYWELYERQRIPLPSSTDHPNNAPDLATRSWGELEGYTDIPRDEPISTEKVRELRHGYYACVSYVDALVGRLLDELKRSHLEENTIVVLWGDHGFHLGEQGLWTKANNYELSTRVPLIVSTPGRNSNVSTDALVELVDLFPTLVDLCELDSTDDLEGISLTPLLDNPSLSWKRAVFSQFPRSYKSARHQSHGDVMGYAVRTDKFRLVQWRHWKSQRILAQELYDHAIDVDEMKNLAGEEHHAERIAELSGVLENGWAKSKPKSVLLP